MESRADGHDDAVTVIVVNHDSAEELLGCVEAFDAQDHAAVTIVVVDNASRDPSGAVLDVIEGREWVHPVRVVRNRTNRGYSGAINDVLASTDTPFVVFSNVDVLPRPDLVSLAVAALLADPCGGTVQPKLLRPGGSDPPVIDTTGHVIDRARLVVNRGEGDPDRGGHDDPGPVFGASGALVLHRRAMLDDVAWPAGSTGEVLTEALFAFFEDVELDWRARRHGWRARYEPAAVALHARGGASGRRSRRVEVLNFANRLLVVLTCDRASGLVRALPLVLLTTGAKLVHLIVRRPSAVGPALLRVAVGLPGALRRRRMLAASARVGAADVERRWMVRFDGLDWVRRWRRRGGREGFSPAR